MANFPAASIGACLLFSLFPHVVFISSFSLLHAGRLTGRRQKAWTEDFVQKNKKTPQQPNVGFRGVKTKKSRFSAQKESGFLKKSQIIGIAVASSRSLRSHKRILYSTEESMREKRSGMGIPKDLSLKSKTVFRPVVKALIHTYSSYKYADFSTFAAKSSTPENIREKNRTLLGTARKVRPRTGYDMHRSAQQDIKTQSYRSHSCNTVANT